jgi:hypothetical protein
MTISKVTLEFVIIPGTVREGYREDLPPTEWTARAGNFDKLKAPAENIRIPEVLVKQAPSYRQPLVLLE